MRLPDMSGVFDLQYLSSKRRAEHLSHVTKFDSQTKDGILFATDDNAAIFAPVTAGDRSASGSTHQGPTNKGLYIQDSACWDPRETRFFRSPLTRIPTTHALTTRPNAVVLSFSGWLPS